MTDPYEAPENPDINLDTSGDTPEETAEKILTHLKNSGVLGVEPQILHDEFTLYDFSEELKREAESYEKIKISRDTIEILQVLADGWANPLDNFMNEKQLLEVIHMKTLTSNGKTSLFSVPLTCHVSEDDY